MTLMLKNMLSLIWFIWSWILKLFTIQIQEILSSLFLYNIFSYDSHLEANI